MPDCSVTTELNLGLLARFRGTRTVVPRSVNCIVGRNVESKLSLAGLTPDLIADGKGRGEGLEQTVSELGFAWRVQRGRKLS